MDQKNHTIPLFLLIIVSCLLLSYTGYRAYSLPLTHDESSTWISLRNLGFWESLQYARYWTDANNHLLNTFLFQQSISLFGQSDWAFRLPNVLAHLLYLGASIYIVLALTTRPILRVAGWSIINLNPYLLDFFSLSRGYGLAMGFTLLSLAFLINYLKQPRWSIALSMFILAGFSILSNFTQFLFFAALWGVYIIINRVFFKMSFQQLLQWQLPPLIVIGILVSLIGRPIYWLQQAGEFEWGSNQLKDTVWHLVADSLYQQGYFSAYTIPIFFYSLSILTSFLIGKGLLFFWTNKDKGIENLKASPSLLTKQFFAATSLLISGILLLMIGQKMILGTEYLVNRKALIFIPIWSVLVCCFCFSIYQNRPAIRTIICIILTSLSCWHFSRSMNFHQVREWWYDQHTLEMLQYLEKTPASAAPIALGIHWMFHPTLTYYQETGRANFVQALHYSKDFRPNKNYEYFYLFKKDFTPEWQTFYQIEQSYKKTYLLIRKED